MLRLFLLGTVLQTPRLSHARVHTVLWGSFHTGVEGRAVATTADGDVVAAGSRFIVVRLAGQSGEELWRHEIPRGTAAGVAIDATGDVAVVGATTAPVTAQLRKLDGPGPCWSAAHDLVRINRSDRFVARGN